MTSVISKLRQIAISRFLNGELGVMMPKEGVKLVRFPDTMLIGCLIITKRIPERYSFEWADIEDVNYCFTNATLI